MVSSTKDPSVMLGDTDNIGVGTGPGPVRHPRPLTAADLHLQLENEQEAVVRFWRSLIYESIKVLIMNLLGKSPYKRIIHNSTANSCCNIYQHFHFK